MVVPFLFFHHHFKLPADHLNDRSELCAPFGRESLVHLVEVGEVTPAESVRHDLTGCGGVIDESRTRLTGEIKSGAEESARALGVGDATQFVGGRSVVEGTTQLLEPLPRKSKREE